MAYIRGQLLKAQLEVLSSDPTPVSTGLIYFNSSTTFAKVYNGSAWKSLVDDTTVQTLQNKVLDNTNTHVVKDTLFTLQDDGDATKQAQFQLSGITAGQTRVMTWPDSNFTAVGLILTQTIQNKTLDVTNTVTLKDTLFTLQDDGDVTKQLRFQLSGITTGTLRTMTVPDVDFTAVGVATTQTLTNKTLTAPAINSPTGIVKGDVGLGNVDNTSDATKNAAAVTLTNKYLQGGTASTTNRIKIPADTTTNLNTLDSSLSAGDVVYDSTLGVVKYRDGSALKTLSTTATATPSSAGIVTSFSPVIASAINVVSSADYSVLTTDGYHTIAVSTGASTRTVNLPAAASNAGRILTVTKTDTGAGLLTVDANGSETISSQLVYNMRNQFDSVTIICDGSGWVVVYFVGASGNRVLASKLGQFAYNHGGTFQGGNAPTVTCGQAGFSVVRAIFIPYQTNSGGWRLRANIDANITSATITGVTLAIAGVTFFNGANQVGAGEYGGNNIYPRVNCTSNTGNVTFSSASATTTDAVRCSFDVELDSIPNWVWVS